MNQDLFATINSLEVCYRCADGRGGPFVNDLLAGIVPAVTGVDFTSDDLLKIGERIWNVEKAFNIREGMRRKDDYLPKVYLVEKETPWGTDGISEEKFGAMLDEYYQFRGWDQEGIPTKQKLEELGLGYLAGQIGAAEAMASA